LTGNDCRFRHIAVDRSVNCKSILIAKRRGLISSARDLLSQLDEKAGVYLSSDLKSTALKSVGE
jgi:predicted nucleic acid-binding protein